MVDVINIVTLNTTGIGATESMIQQAVDETASVIKNYCNLEKVPDGLGYTWANMAEDLVRYRKARNDADTGIPQAVTADSVSEINIGDTSIKLGSSSSSTLKAHQVNADSLIMNYREQLSKFRRLVW